jgi:hypothetical protein
VHYAVALAEQSLLATAVELDGEAASCDRALSAWREYVAEVTAEDPWLERGRRHLSDVTARCERVRERLEAETPEPLP